ncbi:hypothetical protein ACWEOE_31635 [Amycolatopsis sp. NPDC004368]
MPESSINTEVTPPDPDFDGEQPPQFFLSATLTEVDGTYRGANQAIPAGATDEQLAHALLDLVHGVAAIAAPNSLPPCAGSCRATAGAADASRGLRPTATHRCKTVSTGRKLIC